MSKYNLKISRFEPTYRERWWFIPVITFFFLSFSAMSLGAGYYWGAGSNPEQYISDFRETLNQQERMMGQTQDELNADLDAFTHRLGLLQAHVNRLNALGSKMVAMANLDEAEFDFVNVPAMGGSGETLNETSYVSESLTMAMEKLELSLMEKEQQLEVLDEMILTRNLQEQVKPRGKPVNSGWVSSRYGYRNDPFSGRRQFHKGIDFAGKKGTSILAAAGGIVIKAGRHPQYGLVVEIDHRNGYITRYAHNSELLVSVGDVVKKGQNISKMGSTGRSTGTHLHFEVIKNGKNINPSRLLKSKKS